MLAEQGTPVNASSIWASDWLDWAGRCYGKEKKSRLEVSSYRHILVLCYASIKLIDHRDRRGRI